MKKALKSTMTLTLILILLVSACVFDTYAQDINNGVAISEKNFPDEVFRNHLLNGFHYVWDENGNAKMVVYDENHDGYLSNSEIENINQLLIQQSYIRDLTGIEHLTSLIEIGCQFSAVEKMDLYNNNELQYLTCHASSLKGELDLSGKPKLESVSCQRNPELTSIDIHDCPNLFSISLTATGVTEIDTSEAPNLAHIDFDSTDISEFDPSKNEKLVSVSAYNTQLSSLDFSDNPHLEYLDISICKLEGLDVSTNESLTYLNVQQNPLAWLNIGDNKNLDAHISDSTITLDVDENSFDITEVFKGINPDKITIVSDAKIDGNIISSYNLDEPIVYTYDCGTDANGDVTLTVTLNLN